MFPQASVAVPRPLSHQHLRSRRQLHLSGLCHLPCAAVRRHLLLHRRSRLPAKVHGALGPHASSSSSSHRRLAQWAAVRLAGAARVTVHATVAVTVVVTVAVTVVAAVVLVVLVARGVARLLVVAVAAAAALPAQSVPGAKSTRRDGG